jgi:hypothetical protein
MHFLDRHFLGNCRNTPQVSERIPQRPFTAAVELVLYGEDNRRTGIHGVLDEGIHIRDRQRHGDRRIAERFCAETTTFWPFVGEHDRGIADRDFGVWDLFSDRKAHDLPGPKGRLIELDGLSCVLEGDSRRGGGAGRSYRFCCS